MRPLFCRTRQVGVSFSCFLPFMGGATAFCQMGGHHDNFEPDPSATMPQSSWAKTARSTRWQTCSRPKKLTRATPHRRRLGPRRHGSPGRSHGDESRRRRPNGCEIHPL